MKFTITTQEIISKLGLPADTELVIEQSKNEWISNVGRGSCGHPESLSADTEIEVKLRDGEVLSGYASHWNLLWNETYDGSDCDIVAYRVL